jgi:hypothetical protein
MVACGVCCPPENMELQQLPSWRMVHVPVLQCACPPLRTPPMADKAAWWDCTTTSCLDASRCFGGSDGEPRSWVAPKRHVADWLDAIKHVREQLADRVDVSRLALWGTSFAGGHVLVVASQTPNISAIVSQAGGSRQRREDADGPVNEPSLTQQQHSRRDGSNTHGMPGSVADRTCIAPPVRHAAASELGSLCWHGSAD